MNVVPKEFIRVMPDAMRGFVSEAFQKAGTSEEDAAPIYAAYSVMARAKHPDMSG
ncbi:hypothetical protein J4G07_08500 [Candidatus Poribacteria bacterium]|nr:hypothetical protein [Candidatus Poribacteria bacterium]